jgi:hypothetical protein
MTRQSIFLVTFISFVLILFSCSGDGRNLKGIDYRPILGKRYSSEEVRKFLIENKVPEDRDYIRFKLKDGDLIESIFFSKKCPLEAIPYGASFRLSEKLAKDYFGEPSFIYNRTYIYEDLRLCIQFSSDGRDIDDIGMASKEIIDEVKLKK